MCINFFYYSFSCNHAYVFMGTHDRSDSNVIVLIFPYINEGYLAPAFMTKSAYMQGWVNSSERLRAEYKDGCLEQGNKCRMSKIGVKDVSLHCTISYQIIPL